jgi:predicted nucleotidyltransferase
MEELKKNITKTLLYYDIFSHPLKTDEIFSFLPRNSIAKKDVENFLRETAVKETAPFAEKNGYYYIKPAQENVTKRIEKENYSLKMWKRAALVTHLIKRFPFVRAVLVTGSLSKNSSDPTSDLDFMLITAKNRLWISRTLLMLFKKIFFLNSYKFFCINYYITEDNLVITERNIFTATEIATIKATYNTELLNEFIRQNNWVKEYFPNYVLCDPMLHSSGCKVNNHKSKIQRLIEFFIPGKIAAAIDRRLMCMTREHWKKKYPQLPDSERNHMFKSTENVSKTHPGNMQKKILGMYSQKLQEFNLETGS